jgi:hypothetical protein
MSQEFFWTWIPWIFNKGIALVQTTQAVCRVVYNELLVKKEWVFLQGLPIPISSEVFGSIEHGVKWRCSVNPATFVQPNAHLNPLAKERHLSYLGFVVKIPGQDLDLSDWVNEVKWIGSHEPTLNEIFTLWCCENGQSYFHCLDLIQVEYITDMGDTVKRGLMNTR